MNETDWDDLCRYLAMAADRTREHERVGEIVGKLARLQVQARHEGNLARLYAAAVQRRGKVSA